MNSAVQTPRIAILTTDTTHHTFFVKEISASFELGLVIAEKTSAAPTFETTHPFESQRDAHEVSVFFGGKSVMLSDVTDTVIVPDINGDDTQRLIASFEPDVAVVFGTSRICSSTINLCSNGFVNLHGGDPEHYRGLDSHLWSIYHGDYGSLVVTLHRVNENLDDGDILVREAVPLSLGMKLYELRQRNTELCVKLTLNALEGWRSQRRFTAWKQRQIGRYYSFMPSSIKETCVKKFERYTDKLDD